MVGWPGTSARRDPVLGAAGAASVGNAPTSSNAPNPETIVSVELSKEPVPTERAAPAMPSSSVAVPVPLAPKSKRRPGAMTSASATTAVAAPVTASSPRPADPPANKSPAKRGLAEEVPF